MKSLIALLMLWCSSVLAVTCVSQAEIRSTDGGIFALETFTNISGQEHLYVGMFGYDYVNDSRGDNDVMLYRYNGSNLSPVNLTKGMLGNSESVCALKSWKGKLIVATERAGYMFWSANGLDFNRINTFGKRDACDLEVGLDANGVEILVAPQTHGGGLLFSYDGVNWEYKQVVPTVSGNPYLRESFYSDDGFWYIYGILRTDNSRIAYRSNNLTTWTPYNSPGRIFRVTKQGGNTWASQAGVPFFGADNKIGLYKKNGLSYTRTHLSTNTDFSHMNSVKLANIDDRVALMATGSTGFKPLDSQFGSLGAAALLEFDDQGKLKYFLCSFPGQEYAEATAFYKGEFYIGTMNGGYENNNRGLGFGRLYKAAGISEYKPSIMPILQLLLLDD